MAATPFNDSHRTISSDALSLVPALAVKVCELGRTGPPIQTHRNGSEFSATIVQQIEMYVNFINIFSISVLFLKRCMHILRFENTLPQMDHRLWVKAAVHKLPDCIHFRAIVSEIG